MKKIKCMDFCYHKTSKDKTVISCKHLRQTEVLGTKLWFCQKSRTGGISSSNPVSAKLIKFFGSVGEVAKRYPLVFFTEYKDGAETMRELRCYYGRTK